jgi:hypothetical protein
MLAVAAAALVEALEVQAVLVEEAQGALLLLVLQLRQIRVVAVVVVRVLVELLVAQAVPALSSCPTPCQKAQSLNSCLLRHGKPQQASLPLTIWW